MQTKSDKTSSDARDKKMKVPYGLTTEAYKQVSCDFMLTLLFLFVLF
jgi:hypothetical protein